MPGKLIQTIIEYKNQSGAIPPAPHALEQLKSQIVGVPINLLVPGMSSVLQAGNILQMVLQLAKQMGGLQNVGDFQKWIGKLEQMTVQDFIEALGGAGALGAALMNFKQDPGA